MRKTKLEGHELLVCNACKWLTPKEEEQTNIKEVHRCKAGLGRLYHYDKHPLISRPGNCTSYVEG